MKKPDEIKKGLECISAKHQGCAECPYRFSGDCDAAATADALAYIQQLEAELAAVKRQRDALLKTIDVEYIARLEEKAMRCDALEKMIKRGLCKENGSAEDEQG